MVPDLACGGLKMEECGGERGGSSHGVSQKMGFTGFTQSQVDQLFTLFKERQNQEMVEKISGKCLHTRSIQWVLDSGASHHMTSN